MKTMELVNKVETVFRAPKCETVFLTYFPLKTYKMTDLFTSDGHLYSHQEDIHTIWSNKVDQNQNNVLFSLG